MLDERYKQGCFGGASPGALAKLGVPRLFDPQRSPLRPRVCFGFFLLFDETLRGLRWVHRYLRRDAFPEELQPRLLLDVVKERKRPLTPASGMTERTGWRAHGTQSKRHFLVPHIEILWAEVWGTADGKAEEHGSTIFVCTYSMYVCFYIYLCVPALLFLAEWTSLCLQKNEDLSCAG